MKVIVVDTTIAGNLIGGAQTFLANLMHGLSNQGVEVHLVTNGAPNSKIALYMEKSGGVIHTNLLPSNVLVEDKTPILADWVNKISPDIYLISVSPDVGWTVLPRLKPEIATLTIGHTDDATFYEPLKHYAAFITRAVGASEEICQNFNTQSGLAKEKISWIPYGVKALSKFADGVAESDEPIQLIYVGRLEEEQKRASDLIKIVKALGTKGVRYSFKIVGDGESMPKFKDELSQEILENKVHLLGWLNNDELLFHLRQSEIFVLASAYEGFCISLVEAMANGCCPVVTDIKSGNKQLIADGESGFLVPIGNIDGFVEKIEFLELNRTKLSEARQKAWEVGRGYSLEKMVDNYYQCFLKSIADVNNNQRQPNPNFSLMESCRSKYPLWLRRIKAKTKQYISVG